MSSQDPKMDNATLQNGDAQHLPPATNFKPTVELNGKLSSPMTSNSAPAEATNDTAGLQSTTSPVLASNSIDSLAASTTEIENQNTITTVTPEEPKDPVTEVRPAPEQPPTLDTQAPAQPLPQEFETAVRVEEDKHPQNIANHGVLNQDLEAGDISAVERPDSSPAGITMAEEPAAPASGMDISLDPSISKASAMADAPLPSPPPALKPPHATLSAEHAEQPQEPAPTPAAPALADESTVDEQKIDVSMSSEPPLVDQSPVDLSMTDASTPIAPPAAESSHHDHLMTDAPPAPEAPTSADPPHLGQLITDAPLSSGKASRERDEDDEHGPAAKRLKAEGGSAEPEFKVPEAPVHSPPADERAGNQAATDGDSVTAPRLSHMKKVIANLKKSAISASFREPVNPAALNIPTYFDIVKQPMDLGAVDRKLKNSSYEKVPDFVGDFNLIVDNAINFNGLNHVVTQTALKMRQSFDNQMKALPPVSFSLPAKEEKKVAKTKEHPVRTTQRRTSTPQVAAAGPGRSPVTPGSAQTFALGPEGVPLIRRDSSATDGRPKRAIHPPKRRDQEFGPGRPRKKKFEWQLKFCKEVITELKKPKHNQYAQYFYFPVDAVALNIPTYHKIIKKPMDLDTAEKKLDSNQYEKAKDFEEEVRLIFKNCYAFNQPGDYVYTCGQQLEKLFEEKWANKDEWLASHEPASEPPSPGGDVGEEEVSEEEEEDSTDERNDEIAQLKAQMAMLSQTLGNLQSGVPKKNKKKKATPPAPTAGKKSAKSKKKDKASKSASVPTQQPSSKDKKKSFSKSKPEKEHFVTYNEKKYISTGISSLPDARMSEALKIIQSNVPSLKNTHETEIELDIDELPNNVLLKLLNFVKRYSEHAPPEPEPAQQHQQAAAAYTSSAPTSGKPKKNKPMSKQEQEQQIQELKGKLGAYSGGQASLDPVRSAEGAVESSADDDSEESEEE